MPELVASFEVQAAIVAAARASGKPVLDGGRGQPNWLATVPRAGFFALGAFAVEEADAASDTPRWGVSPPATGLAGRLAARLAGDESSGARFLDEAVRFGIDELGFDPDAWVHELVAGILGAGYPTPTRMLHHVELVLEQYTVVVTGMPPGPPGRLRLFGTEGGAAAMADVFRTLRENHIVGDGEAIAIATPIFSPYVQIPVLEDFGFRVVEIHAAHDQPYRFGEGALQALRDPAIKAFLVVNPGNPDSRAITPERIAELRELVTTARPDLVIVADTVYASFVDGFRGLLGELPRNVVCLHSFSKSHGATGNRLGYIAVSADNVLDDLLAAHPPELHAAQQQRYSSLTSDVSTLPFVNRLVADSREVALHNIAGLATPDQVQMALFAIASLLPTGAAYVAATREELRRRINELLGPLGIDPPGGQDSHYYALLDVLHIARERHGETIAGALAATIDPIDVAMRLARDHGVIVLPGQLFDADSWDVRVSLASLTSAQVSAVGVALATVVDELAGAAAAALS